MSRREPRIISDSTNRAPISSQTSDWHDVIGHHRYYGSSAFLGERITETRRGPRPRSVNLFGF
jgi:hypothetical protein